MTTQSSSEKRKVLILDLSQGREYEGMLDSIYSNLIESLNTKYDIQRARNREYARGYLDGCRPIAILITDPALTLKQNSAVLEQIKNYVKSGGLALFCANFASFIPPPDMDKFWKTSWGFEWKHETYVRTGVHLNRTISMSALSSLPDQYSQKAVFIAGVANDDSLYRPSTDSVVQSLVFAPQPVNPDQTAVIFAKFGEGRIGYIGDVNNEQGSQAVIHSMLEFAAKR